MKIVLTRPFYKSHIVTPPLSLGYLSAALNKAGIRADIIDGLLLRLNPESLAQAIARRKPDAVGITCLTAYYHEVKKLCAALRKYGFPIILGGAHPTFLPNETLEETGADFVVCGEGERALVELVQNAFDHRHIQGVYGKTDLAGRRSTGITVLPGDINDLPFPDWSQMPPAAYPKSPHGAVAKRYPIGIIITSRGCTGKCAFCAAPALYGGKIRFRSGESVAAEIQWQIEKFKVREIQIEDDNFAASKTHVEETCSAIASLPVRVPWSCPNGLRADCIDQDLLKCMKQAGCYMVSFGVESASNVILKRSGKNESIEQIEYAINLADRVGLITHGFFIFGLPGETTETINTTIRFASRSRLKRAQFLILDVLPGSKLWEDLAFTPNWGKESFTEPEWIPPGLSRSVLIAAQKRAFQEFYKHPGRIFGLLALLRPGQIPFLLRRLSSFRLLPM